MHDFLCLIFLKSAVTGKLYPKKNFLVSSDKPASGHEAASGTQSQENLMCWPSGQGLLDWPPEFVCPDSV